MRWNRQELASSDDAALPGLRRMAGLVRSVRTPEFDGITFHEVMCRSALNKVPATSAVPFTWTINPYRGCSHACVYCLSGDTLILMGDGHLRPISEVRPGDQVYGTRQQGRHRHYTLTEVLAHWQTEKPAFRLRLANDTTICASGDHRFLTDRGWRQVADLRHRRRDRGQLAGPAADGPFGSQGQFVLDGPVGGDARLRVVSVQPLHDKVPMFDITTGTGDFIANGVVSHNCFARGTHTYLDLDAGKDFDREVVVKVNLGEVVRRELSRPSWAREHVAMGTNTDPYQRAEGRYALMPPVIEALAASGTPFSILTKGTLLRRDLPLLKRAAQIVDVGVGVSLAVLDEQLHRSVEPGTPTPRARLDLIRAVHEAGLPCTVLIAPVLPCLTDSSDHLDALIGAVAEAGATGVTVIPLHLRPGAREWYLSWLQKQHPRFADTYAGLYRQGAYADHRYREWLRRQVRPILRRHGLDRSAHRSQLRVNSGKAHSGEAGVSFGTAGDAGSATGTSQIELGLTPRLSTNQGLLF